MFVDSATVQQFIASCMLRPIAVASKERLSSQPNIPTLIESGLKDFEAYAWQGLLVPKGTPQEAIDRLSESLRAALNDPDIRERFTGMGLEAIPSTPQEMDAYAEQERRSEEHTSELQSLMRISYAVFCLKKKIIHIQNINRISTNTTI